MDSHIISLSTSLLVAGHSGKCLLFYNNFLFIPRLGAHPSLFVPTWPVRAERGGYFLTFCCLISFADGASSTVKCPGWRSGHSGKCTLLNCCFVPVLGLIPSSLCSSLASWSRARRLAHILLFHFCRRGIFNHEVSRLDDELSLEIFG